MRDRGTWAVMVVCVLIIGFATWAGEARGETVLEDGSVICDDRDYFTDGPTNGKGWVYVYPTQGPVPIVKECPADLAARTTPPTTTEAPPSTTPSTTTTTTVPPSTSAPTTTTVPPTTTGSPTTTTIPTMVVPTEESPPAVPVTTERIRLTG